jgi:hypothetical protein
MSFNFFGFYKKIMKKINFFVLNKHDYNPKIISG